ncbi:methyl-accepting chemotaxis protein [Desulfolithobacter sp.]
MLSSWKNIRLSIKFGILFNGLLLIFISFLLLSFYSNKKTVENFSNLLDNDVAIVEHAKNVNIAMLQSRRNEKDFLLRKKLEYRDKLAENVAELKKETSEIRILARGKYEEIVQMADSIIVETNSYLNNFKELVLTSQVIGLDSNSGLRGKLEQAARELRDFVRLHEVDELYLTLLKTRKLEKEYIRTGSDRIRSKLLTALELLEDIVSTGTFETSAQEEIIDDLAKYREALMEFVDGNSTAYEAVVGHAVHIERALNSIYVQGARSLVLNISLHEKQYLLHRNPRDLQATLDALEMLVEAFDNGLVDEQYLEQIENKIDVYRKALLALYENDQKILKINQAMRDKAQRVEEDVKKIVTISHTKQLEQRAMIQQNNRRLTITVLGIAAAVTLGSMLFIFLTVRSIVATIREAVSFAGQVGEGNFTTTLASKGRDEIGQLIDSLNQMVEKLDTVFKKVGNSTEVLQASAAELSESSGAMSKGADQSSEKANNVAAATEEMSSNMNSVAAACEEAATNVNIVAAAVGELSATVQRIATNTSEARDVTSEAVTLASSSSEKVDALGRAAGEISKVTEVITEISEQTNLLALNATIEAARAGEAGKGFAVVANEIKELANQTAAATKEIKTKIEAIQGSTNLTVNEIKRITEVITRVNEIVATIATAVDEQTASTTEIAENIQQAAQGISEVNENVAQSSAVSGDIAREIAEVSQVAGEITSLSSGVSQNAEELARMADELKKLLILFRTR